MKKILLSVMLLTSYGAFSQISDTIYVNPLATTGNDDGTSWADAYLHPASAFNNSTDNNHIWIAQGTYISSSTNRNLVYGWTTDSIQVYGGFSGNGTETSIAQRDWEANPTIFNGDIGVVGDSSDNSYTVFAGPIGSLHPSGRLKYSYVDGIKITGGNSNVDNYPSSNCVGGGIWIDPKNDKTVWKNIEIYNCFAKQGGAISLYNDNGTGTADLELHNIIVRNNTGRSSAGAHIRSNSGANVNFLMTNSLFYDNNAVESISGQVQDLGTVMFLGCDQSGFTSEITNCTFANNNFVTASKSEGVFRTYQIQGSASIKFYNNIFYGNGITDITYKAYLGGNSTTQQFQVIQLKNNILENGHDNTNVIESNSSTSNPLFIDATNGNFRIPANSPAKDSGTQVGITSSVFDIVGNARVSGSQIDLGAYEYHPSSVGIIKNSADNFGFTVYPNPTNGVINIKSTVEVESIIVMNSLGQVIVEVNNQNSVDLTGSPKGLYVVAVKTKNKVITKKIIMK